MDLPSITVRDLLTLYNAHSTLELNLATRSLPIQKLELLSKVLVFRYTTLSTCCFIGHIWTSV